MNKFKPAWIIVIFFILTIQAVLAQSTEEKMIGPITILNPFQTVIYPQTSFDVSFAANLEPAAQTHNVWINNNASIEWVKFNSSNNFSLVSGEQKTIPFDLEWAYFPPAETVVKYISVKVVPNKNYAQSITDPTAITISITKPTDLIQHKLTITREGPIVSVPLQQIAPLTGNIIFNTKNIELYFDHGGTIQFNAPRPSPSPCGDSCPQTVFVGFSGDYQLVGTSTAQVIMDTDKQIIIKYTIRPGSRTPSPPPAPTPIVSKGDANSDGAVDIIDALLVAQYSVGLSVNINLTAADANCDGSITIIDALLIARYTIGMDQMLCPKP